MQTLWFFTSSKNKFEEISKVFAPYYNVLQCNYDDTEIQDMKNSVICLDKLQKAHAHTQSSKFNASKFKPGDLIMVEDAGFFIDKLCGFPGPYVKDFLARMPLQQICDAYAGSTVQAVAAIACCYIREPNHAIVYEESVPGIITGYPKGDLGFGFDPIFTCIQHPDSLTLAQMMPEVKREFSATTICAKKVLDILRKEQIEY